MITHAGADVVFADTDDSTFTIDPAAIEAAITPRTVGIIPVHLYGQPADMDAIMAPAREHVYHLYTIQHPRRDALAAHLNAKGVQTAINYPTALPFLAAYGRLKHRPEQFPNAHRQQGRILSLPMFAEITAEQQRTVIELVRA